MKNFKNIGLLLIFTTLAVFYNNAKASIVKKLTQEMKDKSSFEFIEDSVKAIAKKWKISDFEAPQLKEKMEKASAEEKKRMEERLQEMKDKSSLEFTEDGKFTFIMSAAGVEDKATGIWELKDKKLVTKDDKGKESEIEVVEVSKSKLVLKDKEGIKMTLVPIENEK
ncbi:MAG: hypothetical protein EAZ55_14195 [Cytophagales bacterium]|nr:MAG: hypothetical protein EAZ55_14195 [Cytophagales bacterium]